MSSYEEWTSMFSPEMENIGMGKSKHLKKLDLLLHVFDKEISNIKYYLHTEYKTVEYIESLQRKKEKANTQKKKSPLSCTNFAKPSNIRLKKTPKPPPAVSNIIKAPPKESPDMFFNQTVEENNLDQNIHQSDSDTIMSSPEKFSPKIKKKRILRLNKTKELAENHQSETIRTPPIELEIDDVIESTPEVKSFKKSLRTSTKKKLFERTAPKSSQSMCTLSQLYRKNTQRNKSATASMKCKNIPQVLTELNTDNNATLINMEHSQNSYIKIDELLDKVSNLNNTDEDTEIIKRFQEPAEKRNCRFCDMKGSPCRKHMIQVELKEPNDTFSGFWDLNFTANKPKTNSDDIPKDKDDDNNSTVLNFFGGNM